MKKAIYFFLIFTLICGVNLFSQSKVTYEQPILVTSAGQSADVTLTSTILKKLKVDHKVLPMAKESDLSGIKTLIVVPGFSSKGLGAAGISREQEMERVKAVIAAAKKQKIKILMFHIGGKARRGTQSDDFNELIASSSNSMIVVNQGDEDQFFSKIAAANKTPIKLVDKIADTMTPLKESLNLQ